MFFEVFKIVPTAVISRTFCRA